MFQVKWAQLNKAVGNLQSSPNMAGILNWALSKDSDIWNQRLEAFSQELGLLFQLSALSCKIHSLSCAWSCSSSFLKGSPGLALFSLLSYSRDACLFLSERRSFISSFLCLNGLLLTCLMSLWNSCHSLVQLIEAWISLSLPYLKALGIA